MIRRRRERRSKDALTLVERRKGKVWMHAQVVVCLILTGCLAWLIR